MSRLPPFTVLLGQRKDASCSVEFRPFNIMSTLAHLSLGSLTLHLKAENPSNEIFQVSLSVVPPGDCLSYFSRSLPAPLSAGHLCLTVRGPYRAQCPFSKWHLPRVHVPRPCNTLSFMHLQSREAVLKFLRTMWSLIFMAKEVHLLRMFLPKLVIE